MCGSRGKTKTKKKKKERVRKVLFMILNQMREILEVLNGGVRTMI
jgi:hypothetical protein